MCIFLFNKQSMMSRLHGAACHSEQNFLEKAKRMSKSVCMCTIREQHETDAVKKSIKFWNKRAGALLRGVPVYGTSSR